MWVLTICTGIFLGMCGDVIKYEYESKEDCYQAIERMGDWEDKFAYVVCHPGK